MASSFLVIYFTVLGRSKEKKALARSFFVAVSILFNQCFKAGHPLADFLSEGSNGTLRTERLAKNVTKVVDVCRG